MSQSPKLGKGYSDGHSKFLSVAIGDAEVLVNYLPRLYVDGYYRSLIFLPW